MENCVRMACFPVLDTQMSMLTNCLSALCEVKSHLDYVHGWQNNFVENNARNFPAKFSFNGTSVLGDDCI